MSKLEFVNKLFFQWFFVRLTRCTEEVYLEFKEHPGYGKPYVKVKWYSIQGWIAPTTGWTDDFRMFGKRWFLRITKKKITAI